MSLVTVAAVSLTLLAAAAPILGIEAFVVILLIMGSTRWTQIPPHSAGLLMIALAGLLMATLGASRGDRGPRAGGPRGSSLAPCVVLYVTWSIASLAWTPEMSFGYGAEKIWRLTLFDLRSVRSRGVGVQPRQVSQDQGS